MTSAAAGFKRVRATLSTRFLERHACARPEAHQRGGLLLAPLRLSSPARVGGQRVAARARAGAGAADGRVGGGVGGGVRAGGGGARGGGVRRGAAGGRPRRAGRRAGDARRLRAAVRAGADRRAARTRGTSRRRRTSRSGRAAAARVAAANGAPRRRGRVPGRRDVRAGARCASRCERRVESAGSGVPRCAAAAPRPSSRRPRRGAAAFAAGGGYGGPLATARASRCAPTSRGVRPHGARRRARDGVALRDHERVPLRRRAGRAVRPPPRPEVGRAARATSLHRHGTELDLGPPRAYALAGRQRAALPLRPALRVGALALRLHAQRRARSPRGAARRRRARGSGVPAFVPGALRAGDRPRRAALERLGDAAGRPALRGERASTRSRSARPARRASRSSCPARRAAYGPRRPVRRRARRSTPRRT